MPEAAADACAAVVGANIFECLTNTELDRLCEPLLGKHWVPARLLHDVKAGLSDPGEVSFGIKKRARETGFVVAACHTRHHWATAFVLDGGDRVVVYDSALAEVTKRDWIRLFRSLGVQDAVIGSHARQPRNSNDCGLHVVWLALMQQHGRPSPVLPMMYANPPTVPLSAWRHHLAQALDTHGYVTPLLRQSLLEMAQVQGGTDAVPQPVENWAADCHWICIVHALTPFVKEEEPHERNDPVNEAVRAALGMQGAVNRQALRCGAPGAQEDAHDAFLHFITQSEWLKDLTKITVRTETTQGARLCVETTARASIQLALEKTRSGQSLQQLLDAAATAEPEVGNPRDSISATETILSATHGLVMHLLRFQVEAGCVKKLKTAVEVGDVKVAGTLFKPKAVVVHQGNSPTEGHYTALTRDADGWVEWNDGNVPRKMTATAAARKLTQAYLVFCEPDTSGTTHSKPTSLPQKAVVQDLLEQKKQSARASAAFVHDTVVDSMISAMNRAATAEARPVTIFGTAQTEALIRRARDRKANPAAFEKTARKLRPHTLPDTAIAFVVNTGGHFVTFYSAHFSHLAVFNSLREHTAKVDEFLIALSAVIKEWHGTKDRVDRVKPTTTQQKFDSNECALHALSFAWSGSGEPARIISRDELAEGTPPRDIPWDPWRKPPSFERDTAPLDTVTHVGEVAEWTARVALETPRNGAKLDELRCTALDAVKPLLVDEWGHGRRAAFVLKKTTSKVPTSQVEIRLRVRRENLAEAQNTVLALCAGKKILDETRNLEKAPEKRNVVPTRWKSLTTEEKQSRLPTAYTVLSPGDERRAQWSATDKREPNRAMMVLRFEADHPARVVQCPECVAKEMARQRLEEKGEATGPPVNAAEYTFAISPRGPAYTLREHIRKHHGMTVVPVANVKCPCGDPDCEDLLPVKAAAQPEKLNGKQATQLHAARAKCLTCGVAWSGRLAPERGHPCIPYTDAVYVEPWGFPERPEKPEPDIDSIQTCTEPTQQPQPLDEDPIVPCSEPAHQKNYHEVDPIEDFRTAGVDLTIPSLQSATVRHLRNLKSADPNYTTALIRKGLAYETRCEHARVLKWAANLAEKEKSSTILDGQPVPWILRQLQAKMRTKNWMWSTLVGKMTAIQGAFRILSIYLPTQMTWNLSDTPEWKLAARHARIKASSEIPSQALPATTEMVMKACLEAKKKNPNVAAIIALAWISSARTSQILQMRKQELELFTTPDGAKAKLLLLRGKANRQKQQPHAQEGLLGQFEQFVKPVYERTADPKDFLFNAPSKQQRDNIMDEIKNTLRSANNEPRLENRSIRRGSLQTLARNGASVKVLLDCSGHSSETSLKRYLNYGRISTRDLAKTKDQMMALAQC